ncbi:hypothetical protein [Nevskia sp.]|uniref:hypothetical protein n=1 Tax=Nevskia sp. TaxID=1929292 RepID=UPI0025DEC4E8|nr:hypothetical protein [Nevskia sp.]
MHTRLKTLFLAAAIVSVMALAPAATAGDEISAAEQRVFLDLHLQNVRAAAALSYVFTQKGAEKDSYVDRVTLNVGAGAPEQRELKVDFLSGSRKMELATVEGGTGNPVILYFLEHDIRDMHDRLGGQEAFFRKRIRLALADKATVKPVKLKFGGKTVDGNEVTISPYVDDPLKDRLRQFVSKTYVFTLSEAVPGGVYQLRTHVDAGGAAEPALDTVMMLVDGKG